MSTVVRRALKVVRGESGGALMPKQKLRRVVGYMVSITSIAQIRHLTPRQSNAYLTKD